MVLRLRWKSGSKHTCRCCLSSLGSWICTLSFEGSVKCVRCTHSSSNGHQFYSNRDRENCKPRPWEVDQNGSRDIERNAVCKVDVDFAAHVALSVCGADTRVREQWIALSEADRGDLNGVLGVRAVSTWTHDPRQFGARRVQPTHELLPRALLSCLGQQIIPISLQDLVSEKNTNAPTCAPRTLIQSAVSAGCVDMSYPVLSSKCEVGGDGTAVVERSAFCCQIPSRTDSSLPTFCFSARRAFQASALPESAEENTTYRTNRRPRRITVACPARNPCVNVHPAAAA